MNRKDWNYALKWFIKNKSKNNIEHCQEFKAPTELDIRKAKAKERAMKRRLNNDK